MTEPNNELEIDVTPWEEDDDPESLIGEDLTDEEINSSFDADDEDESEDDESKFADLTDADLEEEVDPQLRSASWHLAPSLVRLRAEVNRRWPRRDKRSDGTLGDRRHSARASDHNPNGRRSVNAIDLDKDGISPMSIVAAAKKHPATSYVIFNRVIYSRSRGFRGKRYTGSNPHNHHVHVSVSQSSSAERNTRGWGIAAAAGVTPKPTKVKPYVYPKTMPPYPGLLKQGSKGDAVRTMQRRLNARGYKPGLLEDGDFGPASVRNLKAFQKFAKVAQTGRYDATTHKLLWTLKVT